MRTYLFTCFNSTFESKINIEYHKRNIINDPGLYGGFTRYISLSEHFDDFIKEVLPNPYIHSKPMDILAVMDDKEYSFD